MAENGKVASADWLIYARLHDSLSNIMLGLKLTIEACDLIADHLRQGVQVDYFTGNPPETAAMIRFAEPPPAHDHIEHNLKTAIRCMGDDWIPVVWENLRPAIEMLNSLPESLTSDLNEAAGDRWIIHTRRSLNDLADSPSPYRGSVSRPPNEAGFPRAVSEAVDICRCGLSRDAWRIHLEQIQERLEQLRACTPPSSAATDRGGVVAQSTSDTEQQMERLAQVIGDDNAVKVLGIAQRTDIGGEEKLREIVKIDIRFKGKKSEELAGMLGVSDAAVRGYDIWKEWRAEQKSLS